MLPEEGIERISGRLPRGPHVVERVGTPVEVTRDLVDLSRHLGGGRRRAREQRRDVGRVDPPRGCRLEQATSGDVEARVLEVERRHFEEVRDGASHVIGEARLVERRDDPRVGARGSS